MQRAEVVLYDRLVSEPILDMVRRDAERIYVGKQRADHAVPQQQINEMLLTLAQQGKRVLRLKGGDPFIFGRGAEEIDHVRQFGLETFVIPGISSSVAVPAYQGIPLTKRGASESFWVITGTTKNHQLSTDVALAAKSTATVVILMGMSKLSEIVKIFSEENKQNTAIAVIQNGTRDNENVGF